MVHKIVTDALEQIDSMVNPGVFLPLIKGLLEDVYIKGHEDGYEQAGREHELDMSTLVPTFYGQEIY